MFPDCATLIRATNGWPQNPRWRYRLPGLQHCAVW